MKMSQGKHFKSLNAWHVKITWVSSQHKINCLINKAWKAQQKFHHIPMLIKLFTHKCEIGEEMKWTESHVLPALTKTSLETIVPTEFTATHLYVDQWTSWRKLSPWNGGK
jgi:hypothetical protein